MNTLTIAGEFAPLLLDTAIKGTVLLLLASLSAWLCRRSSAALRHSIWCMTMGGLLVLPVASWVLPEWQIPILPPEPLLPPVAEVARLPMPVPEPVSLRTLPRRMEPIPQFQPASPSKSSVQTTIEPEVSDPPFVEPMPAPAIVEPAAPPLTTIEWTSLLVSAGWSLGVALFGLLLLVGLWRTVSLRRTSLTVSDGEWPGMLVELRQRLGLARSVELREDAQSVVPLTWGIWRPVVLLPKLARAWDEPMRRAVLLHELAHVQRGDVACQVLGRLTCVLYWFHPLAWFALRQLRQEREQACDDAVVQSGERASDYAEQLLQVARLCCAPRGLSLCVAMAEGSSLERRILSLFDSARSHGPLTRRVAIALFLLSGAILAGLAPLEPTASQAEPDKPSAAEVVEVQGIYERAFQATVNITTEREPTAPSSLSTPGKGTIRGMGSGIIVSEDGHIVTTNHVVEGVQKIRVRLHDGTELPASVVSSNPSADLAVILIHSAKPLTVMPEQHQVRARVGDKVTAIGNAYGHSHTLSRGIVSGVGRDVERNEEQKYTNLIQTDVATTPGGSGGPLLNAEGEAIGIYIALRAGASKIGFAIPINDARKLYVGLMSHSISGPSAKEQMDLLKPVFGEAKRGIQLGLAVGSLERTFTADGRIPLWLFYRNVGDQELTFNLSQDFMNTPVTVTDENGKAIHVNFVMHWMDIAPLTITLKPGEVWCIATTGLHFNGGMPGIKPVVGKYRLAYPQEIWDVHTTPQLRTDHPALPTTIPDTSLPNEKSPKENEPAPGVRAAQFVETPNGNESLTTGTIEFEIAPSQAGAMEARILASLPVLENRDVAIAPRNGKVEAILSEQSKLDCSDCTLSEALRKLEELHHLKTEIDEPGLKAVGVNSDARVSIVASGIQLRSMLRMILEDVSEVPLAYIVMEDRLKLTTKAPMSNLDQNVIWGEPVNGLEPGLWLTNTEDPRNLGVPTDSLVKYRVVVRNTTDKEIEFLVRLLPFDGQDVPYLIPSDKLDAKAKIVAPQPAKQYQAQGAANAGLGISPAYIITLAAGESMLVPGEFGLFVGKAPDERYPQIRDFVPGTHWIVQPFLVHPLSDKERTELTRLLGEFKVTKIDRSGKSRQEPVVRVGAPDDSRGKFAYAKYHIEVGTLDASANRNAEKAIWGEIEKGMQCGVRILNPQPSYKIGDTLEAEVLWRNTSDAVITTSRPRQLDLYPIIEDAEGQQPQIDFGARYELLPGGYDFQPSEVRSLGVTKVALVTRGTPGPKDNKEPGHITLGPGKYKLSAIVGVGNISPRSGKYEFTVELTAATVDPLPKAPENPSQIRGQIIDEVKLGVPNAEVLIVGGTDWNRSIEGHVIAQGITDAKGEFAIPIPASELQKKPWGQVWRRAPGYAAARGNSVQSLESLLEKPLTYGPLVKTEGLHLVVHDPAGKPQPGVRVEALSVRVNQGIGYALPASWRDDNSGISDAEGQVHLPYIDPGSVDRLELTPAGNTAATQFGPNYFLNYRPQETAPHFIFPTVETGVLEGQLVPAPGVTLPRGLTIPLKTLTGKVDVSGVRDVPVDDAGRFRVPDMPVGEISVLKFLDDEQPLRPWISERAYVKAGETTQLEIPIVTGTRVSGRVQKSDTKLGVADYEFEVYYGPAIQFRGSDLWLLKQPVKADADGRYELFLPPGPINLRLTRYVDGYSDATSWLPREKRGRGGPLHEIPAQKKFELPTIDLVKMLPIQGKLIDQNDKPLADYEWTVYGYPRIPGEEARFVMNSMAGVQTEKEGRFEGRYPEPYPPARWNVSHRVWKTKYEFDDIKFRTEVIQESPLILRVDTTKPMSDNDEQ